MAADRHGDGVDGFGVVVAEDSVLKGHAWNQARFHAGCRRLGQNDADVECGEKRERRDDEMTAHDASLSINARPAAGSAQRPGTCPRFQTMNVRVNSMTGVPSWLIPVVLTRTMPMFGREFDSRASR